MKIKLKEHCIGFTLYVDDSVIEKDDYKTQGEVIHRIIDEVIAHHSRDILRNIYNLISEYGDITDSDYCEQCHDTSYTYELEL